MNDIQASSSRTDSTELGAKRTQFAITIPLVGAAILWLLLSNRFPLVETRPSDALLLMLVAVVASALWTFCGAVGGPFKSRAGWSFIWATGFLGLLLASLVPTLNAVLDKQAARVFTTVVNSKRCRKGNCTWELRGVHGLPVDAPTMSLEAFETLHADPGDSLVLGIKPGLFGREWIASRDVHHVERSRLACARLAGPAASGDTIQLGLIFAEGVSIESEEPGLDCEAPLGVAAKAGQVDAVAFLLRRGADPNHVAPDGETPLMKAVRARSLAAVRLLIAHGADPKAIEHPGGLVKSVMGLALEVGDTAIIGTLGRAIPQRTSVRVSQP